MVALVKPSPSRTPEAQPLDQPLSTLRVLHLVGDSQPDAAGAAAINFARATRKAGGQAFWAAPKGLLFTALPQEGIRAVELSAPPLSYFGEFAMLHRLTAFVRKERVALIHLHSPELARLSSRLAAATGIPFVATLSGSFAALPQHQQAALLSAQHLFVSATDQEAAIRQQKPDLPTSLIAEAVDLERFTAGAVKPLLFARFCEELNLNEAMSVALFCMSRMQSKALSLYLDTLPELDRPDLVTLFLLPSGSDMGEVQALEQRLFKAGLHDRALVMLPRADARLYYQLADFVVSDREHNAFDRQIAEAQAVGKPVLVALRDGKEAQVLPGHRGWVFMPDSPLSLLTAQRRILSLSERERQQYAQACQTWLAQHHALSDVWDSIEAIYHQTIDATGLGNVKASEATTADRLPNTPRSAATG
jgi:glycosyltransferase involved in cell wall biosynthesis